MPVRRPSKRRSSTRTHAHAQAGQARGMALLAPAMRGLRVAEYPPNLIKKSVVGAGHAEKKQIQAMIGFLLPKARFEIG